MLPRLVLDTNVLVAGLRSASGASFALVRASGTGVYAHGLTAALVLEYEDVLKRPGLVPLAPDVIDDFLNALCQSGVQAVVEWQLRPLAADPDDDRVLEAAVATASSTVVTYNVADMADGARRYGIELLTPAEALRRLGIEP